MGRHSAAPFFVSDFDKHCIVGGVAGPILTPIALSASAPVWFVNAIGVRCAV